VSLSYRENINMVLQLGFARDQPNKIILLEKLYAIREKDEGNHVENRRELEEEEEEIVNNL